MQTTDGTSGQCEPPYESRRNKCLFSRFPKKVTFFVNWLNPENNVSKRVCVENSYSRCYYKPKECQRCDDYCAKTEDHKRDRKAYRNKRGCGGRGGSEGGESPEGVSAEESATTLRIIPLPTILPHPPLNRGRNPGRTDRGKDSSSEELVWGGW